MADFQTSTHRAKWIFSPQQLVEKYRAANQRAKQILEKCGATLMEVDVDGSLSYPEPQMTAKDSETLVLQSLEFDLIVYAPYRSVEGFINDMEEFFNAGDNQLEMLKTLQETARFEVDKMMLTDAPLLFPPGQLALAALRNSNALHRVIDFDSYLRGIFSRENSMHTMSELSESLDAIDSWVRKYKSPSEKELKHINRKLKSCWGHHSHDEGKKREKKSKHKSKKSSNEAQNMPSIA
ncbi:Cyclin-H1-1 [Glycine soja]